MNKKKVWVDLGLWAFDRLRETSTWRGLILLLTAFGISLDPEQATGIISAGLAIVGLINIFRKSPNKELDNESRTENRSRNKGNKIPNGKTG